MSGPTKKHMQLIPAIDLLNGNVVRLRHGDFDDCKPYEVPALELAHEYAASGAEWLHVVDLAASRDGAAARTEALMQLLALAPQSVQTGGGVRSAEDIQARLDNGADRVVVGTLCVTETKLFATWLNRFGTDRLVSALDIRFDTDGTPRPRTHGWTEGGTRSLWELLDELSSAGLRHLLCTDIGKDGALSGPNLELYRDLVARYPGLQIQASGGVSNLRDLEELSTCGVAAAITGKALLEGRFTVREALEVLA